MYHLNYHSHRNGTISDKDEKSSHDIPDCLQLYMSQAEHLIKVDLHTGNVLSTFLKSVHIDQRIYDTIDYDRHYK